MDIEALKEELERAIKIYKPDGDFGYGTLYNIAYHFAQWGHDKTMEKMPHWKPAARAYLGDRLPRIDYSLNRVVARDEEAHSILRWTICIGCQRITTFIRRTDV